MVLRFCPNCGEKLPVVAMKYCGYCGEKLIDLAEDSASVPRGEGASNDEEFYSVILKSSGDKERLTRRLSDVLQRSLIATRMAVEMVPCVILYKSRVSAMKQVIAILQSENLHYAVIKGEFKGEAHAERVIPGFFQLDNDLQDRLTRLPEKLWLGEKVYIVVPDARLDDQPGTLVVTDLGVFFLEEPASSKEPVWRIVSYYSLTKVVMVDERSVLALFDKRGREIWLEIINDHQRKLVAEYLGNRLENLSTSRKE